MIQMIVEVCYLDDKPIDKSISYKLIKLCLGEKVAKSVTYEVTLPR